MLGLKLNHVSKGAKEAIMRYPPYASMYEN